MRLQDKTVMIPITDPTEIAAVRLGVLGQLDQPIGGESKGQCWAYKWSMERYRAAAKE